MTKLASGFEVQSRALTAEELEFARLIVSTLNLESPAEDIDPDAPLYGEGLGLDSIDILEIALAISKAYGSSCAPMARTTVGYPAPCVA